VASLASILAQRYIGQCNLQTDIKEARFLGADDSLVAAGSDDGRVFIYRAATGECIR
jgi:WD and tetratricopeptide repeat-containing protein 1